MVKKNSNIWIWILVAFVIGFIIFGNYLPENMFSVRSMDAQNLGFGKGGGGTKEEALNIQNIQSMLMASYDDGSVDYEIGEYHSVPSWDGNQPIRVSPSVNVFDLINYPLGDGYNPSDYATILGESESESRSEIVIVVAHFKMISVGGDVNLVWYHPDGRDLFSTKVQIPDPNEESWCVWDECWWEWYDIYSWLGHFNHEINMAGSYYVQVESPWDSQNEPFTIEDTSPPEFICSDPDGFLGDFTCSTISLGNRLECIADRGGRWFGVSKVVGYCDVECLSDVDCAENEICNSPNTHTVDSSKCIPKPECTADDQCGEACFGDCVGGECGYDDKPVADYSDYVGGDCAIWEGLPSCVWNYDDCISPECVVDDDCDEFCFGSCSNQLCVYPDDKPELLPGYGSCAVVWDGVNCVWDYSACDCPQEEIEYTIQSLFAIFSEPREGVLCEEITTGTCPDCVCEYDCVTDCELGEIEKYECGDGTEVDWCVCEDYIWDCAISPETSCPDICLDVITCGSDGNTYSNSCLPDGVSAVDCPDDDDGDDGDDGDGDDKDDKDDTDDKDEPERTDLEWALIIIGGLLALSFVLGMVKR